MLQRILSTFPTTPPAHAHFSDRHFSTPSPTNIPSLNILPIPSSSPQHFYINPNLPVSSSTSFFPIRIKFRFCSVGISGMKFGKRLKHQIQETLPEWRDKFLSYKELKKLVRLISSAPPSCPVEPGFGKVEEEFVCSLNNQIEKFNGFFLEKEEDFIIKQTVSSSYSSFLSSSLLRVWLAQLNEKKTVSWRPWSSGSMLMSYGLLNPSF